MAEVAPGRTVLLVIEAGEGRTAFLSVLAFVAVAVVEVPGTEAVLAERPAVVVTARAEGPPSFFSLTIHEAVATGTEGAIALSIPAEGGPGLRGLVAVTGGIGEGAGPEGLVRILPETGLAETVAVGTAEVTAGRTVLFVIEAGKGTGTLPGVLAFAAVTIVEVPGTEAVLAERPVVVITARAEGTSPFFPLAVHEAVTTGTEGTFVLTIPAEGGAGLRGIVAVTGGIGEGAGPEGLVRILPETGLAEAVAVGTAEIAAGSLVLFVIEAGKGAGTLPGVLAFVAVTVVEVPGTEAVLAERTPLVIAARTEGTLPFFSIAAHETVATGMEGTFVLAIPAEGGPGLRGLVTVSGGVGEGTGVEGLVRILPEAGLAETVAV